MNRSRKFRFCFVLRFTTQGASTENARPLQKVVARKQISKYDKVARGVLFFNSYLFNHLARNNPLELRAIRTGYNI